MIKKLINVLSEITEIKEEVRNCIVQSIEKDEKIKKENKDYLIKEIKNLNIRIYDECVSLVMDDTTVRLEENSISFITDKTKDNYKIIEHFDVEDRLYEIVSWDEVLIFYNDGIFYVLTYDDFYQFCFKIYVNVTNIYENSKKYIIGLN